MIITFFSNYFNHHQKALCDALAALDDVEFYFIETEPMEEFRKNMGWQSSDIPSYVISAHESEEKKDMALMLADKSELVMVGSAPEWYVEKRIQDNKLTFRYTERPMKEGFIKMFIPRLAKKFYHLHYKNRDKNIYVLGASAYAAYDYSLLHSYPGKCLKFGYFPKGEQLSEKEVMALKGGKLTADESAEILKDDKISAWLRSGKVRILWTGRFLKLKRADLLIKALGNIKRKGIDFSLLLVGNGEEEEKLKRLTVETGITDKVIFRDFVKPDEVRLLMERADIYLMTSNFLEGWGSVIYEALSAGCAVIASHACGCTPWLVKPEQTGLIYKSGSVKSLEAMLHRFITDENLRKKCQQGAYRQMEALWNPQVAAERIVDFAKRALMGERAEYEDGPLSRAEILKNNWYGKEEACKK